MTELLVDAESELGLERVSVLVLCGVGRRRREGVQRGQVGVGSLRGLLGGRAVVDALVDLGFDQGAFRHDA